MRNTNVSWWTEMVSEERRVFSDSSPVVEVVGGAVILVIPNFDLLWPGGRSIYLGFLRQMFFMRQRSKARYSSWIRHHVFSCSICDVAAQ